MGLEINPAFNASVPKIISIAPLAFIPKPTANEWFLLIPPNRAPSVAPNTFPTNASTNTIVTIKGLKFSIKFTFSPMETKNKGAKKLVTN